MKKTTPHKGLDVRKIVQHFGGPTALHEQLRRSGYKLTLRAVHQWVRRNQISTKWVLALGDIAAKRGKAFNLAKFKSETDAHAVDTSFLD